MLAEQLTPLELDYLRMIAFSNRQIALEFGVTVQNVKNHWRRIASKFGIDGDPGPKRLRIALRALKMDIVTLDEIKLPPKRYAI